jgi:hypothetical protein
MEYTTLIKDQAYVNGKWTPAASGKTFQGKILVQKKM